MTTLVARCEMTGAFGSVIPGQVFKVAEADAVRLVRKGRAYRLPDHPVEEPSTAEE